ncbi:unnamed protein product [Lactuca saligna]|uniref:Uncharacterized protein n=1 Tax=Lactuca saligna TaxID=75948 RepID=A0AA36E5X3_LACSI|nr:unnamed protein product [Lactuca saligna]
MFITRISLSFGILDKCEVMFLTTEPQTYFSPLMYKWARIVEDNGLGNFSIPNDMPCNQPRVQVRQRSDEAEEDEPPVILVEDELQMDTYNVAWSRFQDNLAQNSNYTNMSLDYMMQ